MALTPEKGVEGEHMIELTTAALVAFSLMCGAVGAVVVLDTVVDWLGK